MVKNVKSKRGLFAKVSLFILIMTFAICMTSMVFASTAPTLTFNFEPAQMFTWTNTMLSALMPVLYITLGISLAFIIINSLKYAFR